MFKSFNLNMIEPGEELYTPRDRKVTYKTLMKDAQVSLDMAGDEKELQRKRKLLMQVYERHTKKIRRWAEDYSHPLMEIDVDDPEAGHDLAKAFKMSGSCWHFDADQLDNDWKNFTFPF